MLMMLVNWIVIIFSLFWSSYACDLNANCILEEIDDDTVDILASMGYISTKIIQKYAYNPSLNMNSVISPMSIHVVLVLLLFGSAGDTQKELTTALKFPTADLGKLKKNFGDIIIITDRKRSKLVDGTAFIDVEGHIKQGLFFQKEFTVVDDFATYLNALNIKTNPLDFAKNIQDANDAINRWIAESRPKSDTPVSASVALDVNTRTYLTSYFYLSAKWKDNMFVDLSPGPVPFNTINEGKIDVKMMKTKNSLNYFDKINVYTAIEIPFEGQDYAAIVFLPSEGVDAINFVTTFTLDILEEFTSQKKPKDVDCQIPIMSLSYAFGLNGLLQELGIKKLFGDADLSKMFKMGVQNFGVQVAHTSDIILSELGANADSILGIKPVERNPPTKNLTPFIADRPFLMLILSTHSYGIVLATFYYK